MTLTVSDLIDFFKEIPDNKWCIFTLFNSHGQCCALGHLEKEKNQSWFNLQVEGVQLVELVDANNGNCKANDTSKLYTQGAEVKARVLKYLYGVLQKNAAPQS